MKKTMRKSILFLAFLVTFTTGILQSASAKFWGWQTTSTTDWADGTCAYRSTCAVHYIFWIGGSEQCVTETIGCVGIPM